MLKNQADPQREVFILVSLLFFTLFQRARRSRVLFLQRLISRRAQRRRRAAFLNLFTTLAWQQRRPKRIAWVLPRPQYWFENLLSSNSLNVCWKENFRGSRETFHFICTAVGPVIQRQDTILRAAIPLETRTAIGGGYLQETVIVRVVLCLELRSLLLLEFARTLSKHCVRLKTNLLNFLTLQFLLGKNPRFPRNVYLSQRCRRDRWYASTDKSPEGKP